MSDRFQSDVANRLFNELGPCVESVLDAINSHDFEHAKGSIGTAKEKLDGAKERKSDEPSLNGLYVINVWLDLMSFYANTWEKIIEQKFSASWLSLQDALDAIRTIKRLSEVDVCALEDKLVNLEQGYPYKVFFSIGAIASRIECSICGNDIDSMSCDHRQGNLYAGKMAYGIVRDFTRFDHVSMVSNPEDKRCVVQLEDTSEQFKLMRYISDLVRERTFLISEFDRITFTELSIPNPAYQKMSRNELCFCGSGRKFKVCCIGKTTKQGTHAKVVARKFNQPALRAP